MTRSTLLGCVAGLLLALDGLEFVMSRTALLDIFVMFWVLAAFGCLVVDRDLSRARLAAAVLRDAARADAAAAAGMRPLPRGPGRGSGCAGGGWPPGCASAWPWRRSGTAIWFLLGFAVMTLAWDVGARRAAGLHQRPGGQPRGDALWLPVSFGLVPVAAYLVSWSGWFFAVRLRPAVGRAARHPHPDLVRAGLVGTSTSSRCSVQPGPDHASPVPVLAVDLAGA